MHNRCVKIGPCGIDPHMGAEGGREKVRLNAIGDDGSSVGGSENAFGRWCFTSGTGVHEKLRSRIWDWIYIGSRFLECRTLR